MIFNNYPYTDFHEMNLDWIISKVVELDKRFDARMDEIMRELLDRLFINSLYIPETETLVLVLSSREPN